MPISRNDFCEKNWPALTGGDGVVLATACRIRAARLEQVKQYPQEVRAILLKARDNCNAFFWIKTEAMGFDRFIEHLRKTCRSATTTRATRHLPMSTERFHLLYELADCTALLRPVREGYMDQEAAILLARAFRHVFGQRNGNKRFLTRQGQKLLEVFVERFLEQGAEGGAVFNILRELIEQRRDEEHKIGDVIEWIERHKEEGKL